MEVEFWFQTILANNQVAYQGWITLDPSLADLYEILEPDSSELQAQCYRQRRLLPPGYQSYSVFGLAFTAAVGVISILLAIIIRVNHESILPHRMPGGRNRHRYLSYVADGQLQVQHSRAWDIMGGKLMERMCRTCDR